ncbi:MAG: enhanced serine sensitivity protein SseB [Actinomycetota bacterium]|nr:enhanced serine sensitivity protein SseB [Actinomycetota bacterium]
MTTEALANPELLAVMRAATEDGTRAGMEAVGNALLDATLLTPGIRDDDGEVWPAGLRQPDGRLEFVCFTDLDAARAWDAEEELWVGVIGSEFIDYVLESSGSRLIVNPAGPFGGALERGDLDRLAIRPRGRDLGALRAPSTPPDAPLRERLGDLVGEVPGLRAVFALEAATVGGAPHPVLGLDLDEGADAGAVAEAVASAIRGLVPAGRPIDLLWLSEADRVTAERLGPPLAIRERGGGSATS